MESGELEVRVLSEQGFLPIENATVNIGFTGEPGVFESVVTDDTGRTPRVELEAPPIEYSMEPGINQPYSEYTANIIVDGYEEMSISGISIMPEQTSILEVYLRKQENIVISANTLYGNYPSKIPEDEVKPINPQGEIVLDKVVIPETIIVHDGAPDDSTAKNYYVKYKDYIKNVASSEIYATWPDATLRANVLAIMSFTLNRVYTEWYRARQKNFTITSSTAYDHKWIYGRNIYENISLIVDEIFDNYLSKPDVKQPILTQYCDGRKVSCPRWMSQWGSKYLGDQGYTATQILKNYYGDDIYINRAVEIQGVPSSWPGSSLTIGSSGQNVRTIQEQLNRIAKAFPKIPVLVPDGKYGEKSAEAVKTFQEVFNLPQTGVVDYKTWYKISEIFVSVSKIAELV